MAAINRVQYHPPPPISFCEGPRIIQKLKDVVVQIVELPLYIPSSLAFTKGHPLIVGMTKFLSCTEGTPALLRVAHPTIEDGRPVRSRSFAHLNQHLAASGLGSGFSRLHVQLPVPRSSGRGRVSLQLAIRSYGCMSEPCGQDQGIVLV